MTAAQSSESNVHRQASTSYSSTKAAHTITSSNPQPPVISVSSQTATTSTPSRPRSSEIISLAPHQIATPQMTNSSSPTTSSRPSSSEKGFTVVAIGGILAGVAFLLAFVFALGFMLRRHKRRKYRRMVEEATTSKSTLKEDSLRKIVVTREVECKIEPFQLEEADDKNVRFEVKGGRR